MDAAPRGGYDGQDPEVAISPLLRPMSPANVGALCTCFLAGVLAACWCILDYWNRQISRDLFEIGDVTQMDYDRNGLPAVIHPFSNFSYPLTLAFLQFVFMGIVFLTLHFSLNQERWRDMATLKLSSDRRWPVMVVSHIFSTFWLQALMMPAQMLSIPVFAASRAVEIPVAAGLRSQVLGTRQGKKTPLTVGLTTAAACIMFFAYAKVAGCACLWSGNGVELSGVAFWIISLLLLAMPAANAVCQEAVMSQPGMHPLLLLALQNILACIVSGPVLFICHMMGWEDVSGAFQMILAYNEVFMLVLWLCAQMAITSLLCITLIHMVDSFWTIALRAVRVLLWAVYVTGVYYAGSTGMPISIACPFTSAWSFVLMCGTLLGAAAIFNDRVQPDERNQEVTEKRDTAPPSAKLSTSASSTA